MTAPRIRLAAALMTLAVVATACGARLSDSQLASMKTDNATRAPAAQSGDTTLPSGDETSNTTAAPAAPSGVGPTATTTATGEPTQGATVNVHALPAGGNGGATDVGVTATQITLGNVATLTGPVPGLFAGATIGAQAVVAYENSLGGLFGRKLKLDARDDQFDTGQNKTQTVDLLSKAFAFVGSFSLYDDAAVNEMKAANVPDVGHALNASRVNLSNNVSLQTSVRGGPLGPFNYLKQKYPDAVSAVGSIFADIPSAAQVYQDYKKAAQSAGYVFKYDRAFGATETDFTSDVVRMRDSGVKMVYLLSVDDKSAARFAKAMQAQNFKPEVFAINASGYDPDVLALGGSAVEGMLVTMSLAMFDGEDAGVIPEVALMDKWVQTVKPGYKPDTFAAYAWASGRLLFDAMERVGPKVTRAAVNDAIRKIGEYTDYGLLASSNPGLKTPGTCFILARVTNGKYVRYDSPPAAFRCGDGGYFNL